MQLNAERNSDGIFINTNCFREEALHFLKYGYYCADPWGSPAWKKYWDEQLNRCISGYTSGGLYITGDHYGYLNFAQIKITEEFKKAEQNVTVDISNTKSKRRLIGVGAEKIVTFPSFWSMDYNYFHVMDIARWGITLQGLEELGLEVYVLPDYLDGGFHIVFGKSRRKGASYKNGWIAANRYNTVENSVTLICAHDKKYLFPEGTMNMTNNYINFFNEHTGWSKARDFVSKIDHKKSSYVEKDDNNVTVEKGYKSTVMALSFRDNPEAAIGKDGTLVLWEEAGKFPNLKESYMKTKPALEDGIYTTGLMCIFGCVCAGTKVWTNDGRVINVEDLKQEDGIIGFDNEKAITQEILNINPPAKKPCVRIVTTHRTLECSIDHPILWSKLGLVYNKRKYIDGDRVSKWTKKKVKWKLAGNIKSGEQIAIVNSIPVFGIKKMWNPRTVGLLIGDGSYRYDSTPTLSNCDIEINDYIYDRFDCVLEKTYITVDGRKYKETRIRGITKQLRDLGIYGQVGNDKRLPDNVYDYDKQSLSELMGGLFDADGYVKIHNYRDKEGIQVILTSSCYELIKQVQELMIKFGVHGTVQLIKPGNRNRKIKDINPYYRFVVTDNLSVVNFYKNIKFLINVKQKRLSKIVLLSQTSNVTDVLFTSTTSHHRSYVDLTFMSGIRFEYVKSVEFIGEHEIYNLTASDTHTYIANGIVTHNTGGSMQSGTTDFADMFYNPIPYKLLPFKNIWDKNVGETANCGFFVPDYWNKPGFIDKDGNSDNKAAREYEEKKRVDIIANTSGSTALNEYIQQYPFSGEEAFLTISSNEFPVVELRNQLNKVKAEKLYIKKCQPVRVYYDADEKRAKMKPDLSGKLNPVIEFPTKGIDKTGCPVILEPPIPNTPRGLYKAGYDPYRQDQSQGESLGAFYVYKSANKFSYTRDMIVAWYVGRPATADMFNRNVELLAEMYNLELMHENEVTEVKSYFVKRNKAHLLASQPDAVISKNIQNSRVSRVYGIHMNEKLKDAGEKYIKKWLLTLRDVGDSSEKILNLETIIDIGLLQELINYHRKGNFDRVIAFMMIMFQIEEEDEGKIYGASTVKVVAEQLMNLQLFQKNKIWKIA